MEKENMIFNLSEKLEYSDKGEFTDTLTLEISAPSMAVFDETSELSQLVMAAMLDATKNLPEDQKKKAEENQEEEKIDAAGVKAMLNAARSVKWKEIRKCFNVVALKCATFDGKIPITETTLNKFTPEDFTRMVCEYIANFIFPSLV